MPLYKVPFQDEWQNPVSSLQSLGLTTLYYKSIEGPLGFCIDDRSWGLLNSLLLNKLWFSVQKRDFYILDEKTLYRNRFNLKGLLWLDTQPCEEIISRAKEALIVEQRNRLLHRYGRTLLDVSYNPIIGVYNEGRYAGDNVRDILLHKNVLIWNWHEYGGHFIFHDFEGNKLMESILRTASEIGEPIVECASGKIPPW